MIQFEYYNANLLKNTALKIPNTVGAKTPPTGYAFGVLSALTNLEMTNSNLVENANSVYVNTLDIKIPTEETMVEYVEYVFEHDAAKRDSVIIKSNTIPVASAELLGYEYQYMGETNNTYTHGFVYVCKGIPTDTLVFTPDTVSCDWANLSAFLQTETADYNSVVAGSMTYFADAELWRATFTDANGDTVLTYQQYTGDWEDVGFVFSQTFEDGDIVSFVRHTESDYVWERVDLQPNHEQDIVELQTNVVEIQSVIPAQASASNQLADKNYVQVGLDGKQDTLSATDGINLNNNVISGKPLQDDIADINALIPTQATTQNQLADKNFVNSSIATNTATFRGTYNSVAELNAYSGEKDNNDYAFVTGTDSLGNTYYDNYVYNGESWAFRWRLNNSSFTASQWATINSNATAEKIAQIDTNKTNITNHIANTNNPHSVTKAQVGLGNVNNTSDLDKPISTATQTALNGKQATISDLATIRSNAQAGKAASDTIATYGDIVSYDAADFATAAQGGKADTALQPGDNVSELVNDAGYLTQHQTLADLGITATTTELNYTDGVTSNIQTQLNNKQATISDLATIRSGAAAGATAVQPGDLATVATSGSYNDLSNKPTIPAAQVNSDWNANSGVAQILNKPTLGTMASESASDYTPTSQLATVATTGSYNDLSNKPTIPTVNNSTITITQGGVPKGSFSLNQATDDTIDLDAGGSGSSYHPELFSHEWDDHERNNMSWVNALTFSWQNRTDHEVAYQHLVDDYNSVPYIAISFALHGENVVCTRNAQHDIVSSGVQYYAWERNDISDSFVYTTSVTPGIGSTIYNSSLSALTTVSGFVDGSSTETITGITITYYQAPDGHKLVLPDQESNVEAIYLATGVAWYYILDETNQRFKLPRAKNLTGSVIGTGKTLGLVCGQYELGLGGYASGLWPTFEETQGTDTGSSASGKNYNALDKTLGITTDATKSGIIAERDTTDQYKYLYFYVGNFTQEAIENTAGLNASLFNGKADTDLSNVSAGIDFVVESQLPTAANNYTWYRKYKSGWVEQGGYKVHSSNDSNASVTFPVAMSDTNYVVSLTKSVNNNFDNSVYAPHTRVLSATGFTYVVNVDVANSRLFWTVFGIAAS